MAHVHVHPLARLCGIMALERLEDRAMLGDVLAQQRRVLAEDDAAEVARQASVQVLERADDRSIARRLLDRLVEVVVRAPPQCRPLVRDAVAALPRPRRHGQLERALEPPLRAVQPVELLRADPLGCERRCKCLELGAHLVGVADLARREAPYERAAVRLELDEPGRLQLSERLADGRAADAELLGERLLAEPRPRRELAAQDLRLDLVRQLVDEHRSPTLSRKVDPVDEALDTSLESRSPYRLSTFPNGTTRLR